MNHWKYPSEESRLRKILLAPLGLLSFFYEWAVSLRIYLYRQNFFAIRSLACQVVSVGNITLGGTGKTPFVILIAEMLQGKELRVGILSRGYKGNFRGPFQAVSDGQETLLGASQAGDEPYLLSKKLKGIPIIVGKNRWRSGQYAIDRFQTKILILDDGFQYLALKRDVNLLLIDAACPFGNGYLFPRGVLREPLSALSRADAIILTKAPRCDNLQILKNNLSKAAKGIPVFQAEYAPGEIHVAGKEIFFPPEDLGGKAVLAFSGIAQPGSFQQTLQQLRARVVEFAVFPDHHRYRPQEMEGLANKARELGVEALVTTEKDLARCQALDPRAIPLWGVSIRHVFLGDDRLLFEDFLLSKLNLAGRRDS